MENSKHKYSCENNLPNNMSLLNVQETIEKDLFYLELFRKRGLIPKKIYSDIKNSLNITLESFKNYKIKILLTGLINSGKSTFINTILGKFILHTSTVENTKWPLIIRNSDKEEAELYSACLKNDYIYEMEENHLLAKGEEDIIQKLVYLNTSSEFTQKYKNYVNNLNDINDDSKIDKKQNKKLDMSSLNTSKIKDFSSDSGINYKNRVSTTKPCTIDYKVEDDSILNLNEFEHEKQDTSKNDSNEKENLITLFTNKSHCDFIFILKIKFHNRDFDTIDKNTYEFWDIPGLNSNNNAFSSYVVNNIIQNEKNLSNLAINLPFMKNYQKLYLIYLSEFSTFNQSHNKMLWGDLKDIRQHCHKVFLVINKIDQMSEEDIKLILQQNGIYENQNTSCDNVNNSLNKLISSNFITLDQKYDNISLYFISSLYAFIEKCEKEKILNNFYWKIKENIFNTNFSLKKEFKTFDKYKKYTTFRVEDLEASNNENLNESEFSYLNNFNKLQLTLSKCISSNKFLESLLTYYKQILKSFVFHDKPTNNNNKLSFYEDDSYSFSYCTTVNRKRANSYDNSHLLPNHMDIQIANIQNLFSDYYKKFKQNIKYGYNSAKVKIEKKMETTRGEIDKYIDEINLYTQEKFQKISEFYRDVLNDIINHKNEFRFLITEENKKITQKLKMQLEDTKLKPELIEYFLKKVNADLNSEIKSLDEKFQIKSSDLLMDISHAISTGILNGVVAFFGTNVIQTMISAKGAGYAFVSSTLICLCIGISCLIFCSIRHMKTINNQNKQHMINEEKELWKNIEKYNKETFLTMKEFVFRTRNNINKCKNKLNGFFAFINKTMT